MAKKAYIGVDGAARKVKKMYLGIPTDLPIYSEETRTVAITADNIADYFYVTNGSSYYFAGSGDTFTSNNAGVDDSTATTILTAKYDISTLTFSYSYSSEANYDKFTLRVAGVTVENAVSGATTSKSYSGSLAAGQPIEFTYAKDNSTSKNDDKCTFSTMELTATVLTQTGTETKSVARKIKKAYIGIGGVARPCFSGGELAYYGTTSKLSQDAAYMGATSVGDYALFGGGSYDSVVNAYSSTLTKTTADNLAAKVSRLGATTVGEYALFGGGKTKSGGRMPYMSAYNKSLAKTSPGDLSSGGIVDGAVTVGNYALFCGLSGTTIVNAYNTSLTRTIPTELSEPRDGVMAVAIGDYALLAGGGSYGITSVDVYNASLTFSTATPLSETKKRGKATTVGNYAVIGGGSNGIDSSHTKTSVDVYNAYLTKTTATPFRVGRLDFAATTLGNYAIFAGGDTSMSGYGNLESAEAYDTSLTRTTPTNLNAGRVNLSAATVGNYALFAGGETSDTVGSAIVDVYTIT